MTALINSSPGLMDTGGALSSPARQYEIKLQNAYLDNTKNLIDVESIGTLGN